METSKHHEEMSIMTRSVSVTGVWVILGYAIMFMTEYVTAKIVGAEVFGTVSVGIAMIAIFQVIANAGTDKGLLRFGSFSHGRRNIDGLQAVERMALTVTSIISIVLLGVYFWLIRPNVSNWFPGVSSLKQVMDAFILVCPIAAIAMIYANTLTAIQHQQYQHIENTIVRTLTRFILLVVLGIWFTYLSSYVTGAMVGVSLGALFLFAIRTKRLAGLPYETAKDDTETTSLKNFMAFSLPLSSLPFFNLATQGLDLMIAGHYLTGAETGIYALARRMGTMLLIPMVVFAGIVGPSAVKLTAMSAEDNIEGMYAFAMKWTSALSAALFCLLVVESRDLLFLVGREYVLGESSLIIIATGSLVNAGVGPSGTFLYMMNKPHLAMINSALSAILAIGLGALLTPVYRINGIAIAISVAFSVPNILSIIQIRSVLKIKPFTARILYIRLGAVIFTLVSGNGLMWLCGGFPILCRLVLSTLWCSGAVLAAAVFLETQLVEDQLAVTTLRTMGQSLLRRRR